MADIVKICGIATPDALDAAVAAGADWIGFVRFPRSPRHLELPAAAALSRRASGRAGRVLLAVDPSDAELDEAVAAIDPDMVQLHGHETPERVASVRARCGRPVMKAVGIAGAADLARASTYAGAADRVLVDAKATSGAALPGGNGIAFDWTLLRNERGALQHRVPVMLSGGLTPGNVADAIRTSGLRAVDVSSGVESRPGIKDPDLIASFIRAARAAFSALDDERSAA